MAGVYIHIPFCKSRCKYCDFFSTTLLDQREKYVAAVLKEAEARQKEMTDVRTVYLGGGTPSLLTCRQIESLLEAVHADRAEEVTIEANPGDISREGLEELRKAGVNRVSIGVQSLHDRLLTLTGRRHTADEARKAVEAAQKAGIDNISVDLIYGLPTQSTEDWAEDIRETADMGVQHLSCYCLSYEEGTPLQRMLERGEVTETDEDTENMMHDMLCDLAEAKGYEHYEVSNFAKPGFRSRHNSAYWTRTAYTGLGAGAHSYDGERTRRANVCDLNKYMAAPAEAYTAERLTDTDIYNECVMLALRTAEGVQREELRPESIAAAEKYLQRGLLRQQGGQIAATREGLHILNMIIEDMMI